MKSTITSLAAGLLAFAITLIKLPLMGTAYLLVTIGEALDRARDWLDWTARGKVPDVEIEELFMAEYPAPKCLCIACAIVRAEAQNDETEAGQQ